MKRIGFFSKASLAALALLSGFAAVSSATTTPTSAVVLERLYNDCALSTVTSVNNYPASISISDSWNGLCIGFANAHVWNFSADGVNSLSMGNSANYSFKATVNLSSSGGGVVEGGIHIAPWWNNVDGRFQARIPDGEVACFGGRLPFYSFTANHGVSYVAGTPITMEIVYLRNKLAQHGPATIQYKLQYGANSYSSPEIAFDQGNPSEDPPHGLWGALDPSFAGGVVQVNNGSGGSNYVATWSDIEFVNLDSSTVPGVAPWSLFAGASALLALGGAFVMRRRGSAIA